MAEDSGNICGNVNDNDPIVAQLEQRIVALETGNQYEANKAAMEEIEMKHLQTLREIRTALLNEQSASMGVSTAAAAAAVSSAHADHSGLESLRQENELLKKKMLKLEYRIQHLVSNMEILYEKSTEM